MSTVPNPPDGPSTLRPVGLVPAAGRARRLGELPCSKELLPVAFEPSAAHTEQAPATGGRRLRVVSEHLLDALYRGGAERALVVIDREKNDLPRFFAGRSAPPALAFVAVADSPSVPRSIEAALPFVGDAPVALGFPDVLFEPHDAFARIDRRRRESGAAVVLGLFPAEDATSTDMVDVTPDGRVQGIEIRPRNTLLALNWLIAVWDRRFTGWLTERLRREDASAGPRGSELQLGTLFSEALADGVPFVGVPFRDGAYLDIGTPEGYSRALTMAGSLRRGRGVSSPRSRHDEVRR